MIIFPRVSKIHIFVDQDLLKFLEIKTLILYILKLAYKHVTLTFGKS